MTNPTYVPPGFYPDPHGGPKPRWWDGAQWTDTVQEATPQPYATTYQPYQVAGPSATGTATGTWQIWTIITLFALQMIVALMYMLTIDWSAYMEYSANPALANDLNAVLEFFNGWYWATLLVSFVAYAGGILLGYLDSRELSNRGVDRPFHWAWNFLPSYGATVYVIGRSVVVKRRTGGGLAPLWAYIILFVVSIVASVIVAFAMMGSMFSELSNMGY